MNRRRFLGASGAAAVSLGWPTQASWGTRRGSAESLRVLFFTDIHARVEWDTPEAMSSAAQQMNDQRADLALCGGDCITDGFQSSRAAVADRWAAYREHLRDRLSPRLATVIGNHDFVGAMPEDGSEPEADPRAAFREELDIPRTFSAFAAAGYHIILLDSVQVTADALKFRGYIDEAQLAWLRDELARVSPETPIVLVTHMPLLTSFFQATEGHEQARRATGWWSTAARCSIASRSIGCTWSCRDTCTLTEMLRWRGTTFITGGAVCGKWWRGSWHGTDAGFGVLTLRPDRVDWEYREIGWVPRRQ
jgi:hypothetical protein